jgi:hypothetical protein
MQSAMRLLKGEAMMALRTMAAHADTNNIVVNG